MTEKKLVLWVDPDGGRHEIRAADMKDAQKQISALRKELGFPEPSAANNIRTIVNEVNKGFIKPEDQYIDARDLTQEEREYLLANIQHILGSKEPSLH